MVETRSQTTVVVSPVAWQAAWLSLHFVLDVATISRGGGDLLDPLLVTTILDANQAVLHSDLELQRRYGDHGSALPDELRRPISVHALSVSLRLPYETVRRRVRRLADQGVCRLGPHGVVVPQAIATSAPYVAVQALRVARLAQFETDLAAAGVLTPGHSALDEGASAVRASDRALGRYMLRTCEALIALSGSAMAGFLLLGLCATNLARLPRGAAAPWPGAFAALARPATASELARRLHMPAETVRRNLFALAEAGFAERSGRGWIAAAPAVAQSRVGRLAADNQIALRALFARLEALGEPPRDVASRPV
ncbi:helix-turn-helix domain-containing protein [Phenylobacterium sp.]|uniref:helix-turn-helix domain-containing protein n=1 Tax=Phenylobacterium sp. TaxID=1871053 RepID=UPI002DE8AD75|nr:helix-turn-helix domain-containing protein [Phenylobacterium sp.]